MEEEALVIMVMGQTSPAFRSLFGTTVGIGSQGILLDGLDWQKAKYLPKLNERRDPRLIRADRARSRIGRRLATHDRNATEIFTSSTAQNASSRTRRMRASSP
jgi:hypothetical protein